MQNRKKENHTSFLVRASKKRKSDVLLELFTGDKDHAILAAASKKKGQTMIHKVLHNFPGGLLCA